MDTMIFLRAVIISSLLVVAAAVPHRRGPLSSIVERGCIPLAHYVRDNYYSYEIRRQATVTMVTPRSTSDVSVAHSTIVTTTIPVSDTTTHINWVTFVYDRMRADYVPMELFKGLVNCGREYSLFAINAPASLLQLLAVNYRAVPGLVG
ncbi:uncharacterized protein LOC127862780 [Dreissena polymorpha]|uniref:Uncharacterized protein n=1 Tax=Dreissena polymorpha TaxID=45954 RepID=A0A9D3YED6_DREPO|nr:uncharacterized protein LOC127862780 [Dreissena polymorpha]KAH3696694.1 hypothetical protein DPMN_084170 [Dreissena polymorpha]